MASLSGQQLTGAPVKMRDVQTAIGSVSEAVYFGERERDCQLRFVFKK